MLPQIVVEDRADAGDFRSGGGDGDYLATVPRHDPSAVWEGGGEQLGLNLSELIYQHRIIARSTQRRVAEVATRGLSTQRCAALLGVPRTAYVSLVDEGRAETASGGRHEGLSFRLLVLSCNFKCVRSRSVFIVHGLQFQLRLALGFPMLPQLISSLLKTDGQPGEPTYRGTDRERWGDRRRDEDRRTESKPTCRPTEKQTDRETTSETDRWSEGRQPGRRVGRPTDGGDRQADPRQTDHQRTDGKTGRRKGQPTDRQPERKTDRRRQTDRQADRRADRQTARQTDGQPDQQTGDQTDRPTDPQDDRHADTPTTGRPDRQPKR